jgi:hypothetical protein
MVTMKILSFLSILSCLCLSACTNLTPAQQASWNATGTVLAQRAGDLALDEAAARLRASRTADNK